MAAGDITYTNRKGVPAGPCFASGTVSADADTAVNVICGFVPNRIELWYSDAGATANHLRVWFKGMDSGYYAQIADAGDLTFASSGGPTLYGDTSDDTYGSSESADGQGFTIPAGLMDADSDTIYWCAFR